VPTQFTLPELGENVAGGDVLRVLVSAGDTVQPEQPVLELETDKATVEVPSSVTGKVSEVKVKAGDKIKVGQVVFLVEGEGGGSKPAPANPVGQVAPPAEDGGMGETGSPFTSTAPPDAPPDDVAEVAAGSATLDAANADGEFETPAPAEPLDAAAAAGAGEPAEAAGSGEPALVEFTLPELGENVAGGDVLHVLVKVGDTLEQDQPVLELETDKATVEVPSNVAGVVTEVKTKPGTKVRVGEVVLVVQSAGRGRPKTAAPVRFQQVHAAAPREKAAPPPDKPGMLEDALEEERAEAQPRPTRGEVVDIARGRGGEVEPKAPRPPAPAAPSVRRAARELGVDVHDVKGSGPGGRISLDDVKAHVKKVMESGGPHPEAVARGQAPAVPLPDFSKWGAVRRQPMRGVRRKTAEHLSHAWSEIPHVTQFDVADITALEDLRKQYGKRVEAAGGKLTVTAVALKVLAGAMKVFPQFNTSVDMAAGEVIYKSYCHVGVAVDTDRGLLVPVIRDVDKKNITVLSAELAQASEKARAGKLSLDEMQGGCITITNLGGIGGTHFTPIVNHPEVAILGLSRARMEPVWKGQAFEPRLMLPLSLSYDHRVIDGADGIRFLRWVVDALEQPFVLSLEG
jgi:pyruvate dehydrogenase E2 component (dihydrolipoamide acetyltransferase)